MTSKKINFERDIVAHLGKCSNTFDNFLDLLARPSDSKTPNINNLADNLPFDDLYELFTQASSSKYQSKEMLTIRKRWNRFTSNRDFVLSNMKVETMEYSIRILKKDCNRNNIVGKVALYLVCVDNEYEEWLDCVIERYDADRKKHVLVFAERQREFVSFQSAMTQNRLKIFERTDRNEAIKASSHLAVLANVFNWTQEAHQLSPEWTRFENSEYGRRPFMWRGLRWGYIQLEDADGQVTPYRISSGSTLRLHDGAFIYVVDVTSEHVLYCSFLPFAKFTRVVKRLPNANILLKSTAYHAWTRVQSGLGLLAHKRSKIHIRKLKAKWYELYVHNF